MVGCRHTFCTNAAKRGISVETLKYLMGHTDISVPQMCIHTLSWKMHREKWRGLKG